MMEPDLRSVDLPTARVLLTNDDGIDAAGFAVLEEIIRPMVGELWVCAPAEGHSGASAMVSLRREIEVRERGLRRYAVTGRPADTVLAALRLVMKDAPPDLVLSGINHGLNIGVDLIYSGTVGAAISAAANGVPAVAFSADHVSGHPVEPHTWDDVRKHLPAVLGRICWFGFAPNGAYGVNFPSRVMHSEPQLCRQGQSVDTMHYVAVEAAQGRYILHHQDGDRSLESGTDTAAIQAGRIGITPLTLDRTDRDLLHRAAEAL
jgi:5'-nucleotidase